MEATSANTVLPEAASTSRASIERNVYRDAKEFIEQNISLVVLSIGLAGNFLTLLTMTLKKMREQPTSTYFCGLAIADSMVLAAFVCMIKRYVEPLCHYCGAVTSASTSWSAFIVLAVTAERAMACLNEFIRYKLIKEKNVFSEWLK
jgi:hypothetical protein